MPWRSSTARAGQGSDSQFDLARPTGMSRPTACTEALTSAGNHTRRLRSSSSMILTPTLSLAKAKMQRAASELLGSWSGADVVLHGDLEKRNILRCHERGLVPIGRLPRRARLRRRLLGAPMVATCGRPRPAL